jgi:hypothetical protein
MNSVARDGSPVGVDSALLASPSIDDEELAQSSAGVEHDIAGTTRCRWTASAR